jgi:hypothetical protein
MFKWHPDIEEARNLVCVAEDFLAAVAAGSEDVRRLAAIEVLLGGVSRSCGDSLVQYRLHELQRYAHAFSSRGHESWSVPPLSGADYLRLQIIKTLNALHARLRTIAEVRAGKPYPESGRDQRLAGRRQ